MIVGNERNAMFKRCSIRFMGDSRLAFPTLGLAITPAAPNMPYKVAGRPFLPTEPDVGGRESCVGGYGLGESGIRQHWQCLL